VGGPFDGRLSDGWLSDGWPAPTAR